MKRVLFFLLLIGVSWLTFNFTTINSISESEATELARGTCKKCGCKSWRTDSDEKVERCLNIRVPSKKLCQHKKSDHKKKKK